MDMDDDACDDVGCGGMAVFQCVALGLFALIMMAAGATILDAFADVCEVVEELCVPYRWLVS